MIRAGFRRTSVAVVLLILAAVVAVVIVVPQVASASTDQYGFDLSVPDSFDPNDGKNPYGEGKFTLDPKFEPLIWGQADGQVDAGVYNYDAQLGSDALMNQNNRIGTVSTGSSNYKFVSTVGYDPNGTGHDDGVAVVGLDDSNKSSQKLAIARYDGKGGQIKRRLIPFMRDDDSDDSDFPDDIEQWAYNAYFVITAGDYDGNGTDELAVYFFQRGNPRVLILNGQTLQTIREFPLVDLVGQTGAYLSSKFHKDSWTARATVQLSMDSSDINRDGKDDLLVVASYADIYDDSDGKKLTDRSSVLGYYPSASELGQGWRLGKGITDKAYMRTASVSAGDLDYDGYNEVVVAGYYAEEADSDSLNQDEFLVTTLDYNPETHELDLGTSHTVDMNKFTSSGLYSSDTMVGTPALTCFKARGRNAAEDMFLAGTVYRWATNGWNATNTANHCTESDNGIGSWIISNTWVDQCVAANFDCNALGAEQVLFSSGYKQNSVSRFFYRVALVGYKVDIKDSVYTVGDFYECNNAQVVYRSTKGNRPCCALAALDVDDDTDVYCYKGKSFEYSNVNVMAILQPPPYFDDIKGNYFAAIGTTNYGETSGSGQSTSVSLSLSAGFYVSVEADLEVLTMSYESSFEHSWSAEYEKSLTQEWSWTLENHSYDNGVALYRTPVTLYDYEVLPAGGGDTFTMTVGIPSEPVYSIMDAKKYNALVADDPTMTGKEVTTTLAKCTPGDPGSYPNSSLGLKNFTGAENKMSVSNRTSDKNFVTQSITTGTSTSASQSYSTTISSKFGASGGIGVKVGGGVSVGSTWGTGQTTVDYKSVTKSGQVAYPPATESEYAFSFRFGTWSTQLDDTTVPVLGYVVDNVQSPPSRPKDLAVDTVSSDSITISWKSGMKSPQLYEVYQYFEDDISGEPYSLIATIDGSSTSYTYEGLLPNTTYQLALRSISYENGERKASEYTSVVSGTTLSDEEAPIVTGITGEQNVCVHDTARFVVTARPSQNATSGLTYAWQQKLAGSTHWSHCGAPSDSTLTLSEVTQDMDGNHYRCVVSETIGGTRRYAYSDVGVLNVGLADSQLMVTATNVDQRQNNPYLGANQGLAGTIKIEDNPDGETTVPTDKQISITVGNETEPRTFVPYANDHAGHNPEYVYLNSGTYYVLEGLDEDAGTALNMVELVADADRFSVDNADSPWNSILPSELVRTGVQATYDKDGTTYLQYHTDHKTLFVLVDDGSTTWYELNDNGDLVEYSGDVSDAAPVMAEGDEVVYVLNGAIVDEGTEGAVPYDKYWPSNNTSGELLAYCASDGTGAWYTTNDGSTLVELTVVEADGVYRAKGSGDVTYLVQIGDAVQVQTSVVPQQSVTYAGDEVRLVAQVSTQSAAATLDGTVIFILYNTSNGDVETYTADMDGAGTATKEWLPSDPGVYEVYAMFSGNSSLKSSVSDTKYYALDQDEQSLNLYALTGQDVTYGDTMELTLSLMETDEDGSLVEKELPAGTSVRYKVYYNDQDGKEVVEDLGANHTYTPKIAGCHTFVAEVVGDPGNGARNVAYALKRPIVVTAPSRTGLSSGYDEAKIPSLADVEITYRGDETKDAIIDDDKESCAPYVLFELTSDPELTATSGEGVYTTAVNYRTVEASEQESQYIPEVQAFLQKYDAELKTGQYVVEAGVYAVSFSAGSNGQIVGYKGDNMRAIDTGDSLDEGTKLNFVAIPNERFKVGSWSVVDSAGRDVAFQTNDKGDQITISSLDNSITVYVTFEPASYQLSFAAGENGAVEGAYMVDDEPGTQIVSPEDVGVGKAVVLTATPDEGYVVDRWTIARDSGAAQEYTDQDGRYSASTLTIERMDANMSVMVYFVKEEYHRVSAFVTSEDDGNVAGCKVLVDGVREDGMALHGSKITLTASMPDQMVVKEWRLYLTDEDYIVLKSSASSYVVGSLQHDMRIGVEVAPFKQFKVHYCAQTADGQQMAGVVSASSADVALADGDVCSAYVSIDFATSLPAGYQVGSWTVKTVSGDEEVAASGRQHTSFTLAALLDETWITLYLVRRPTLAYGVNGGHGTITCTDEGRASGDVYDKYRTDDIVFVLTPDAGYEVDQLVVEPADAYDRVVESKQQSSDVRTYTLKAPEGGFQEDITVTATFRELPYVDLAFGLYDDGAGTHGTISAQVERNGDDRYARTEDATATGATLTRVYRDSVVHLVVAADEGYGIVSWLAGGNQVLGTAGLSYARLGETDNELLVTITDELLNTLGDKDAFEVLAQNGLAGGAVTFGAKNNTGGTVVARNASGASVEYGTMFGSPATITFEATPNEGREVIGWEVNGVATVDTGTICTVEVDGLQAYDVRAVISELDPVQTYTLTFGAIGDADTSHGSVSAKVSKLPDEPQKGQYSTSTYVVGDELTSGCAVDVTTGVSFEAQAEKGYAVEGWYTDEDCTIELAGSATELTSYQIDSIEADTTVYVKFEPVPTFNVEVVQSGTGEGSFAVLVDGVEVGEDKLTPTNDGVSVCVRRHGSVEVVAKPENEYTKVTAWNGSASEETSYKVEDVVGNQRITFTLGLTQINEVLFEVNQDCKDAGVKLLDDTGDEIQDVEAVNTKVRLAVGKTLRFDVVPAEGKMVDYWKVTYVNGSVTQGAVLGIDNSITLKEMLLSATVEVYMRDIVAHEVPLDGTGEGTGYMLSGVTVSPNTLGDAYPNKVRDGGTVSFVVSPEQNYVIDGIADNNSNVEGGTNVLTAEPQADGSYVVTITNVCDDVDLQIDAKRLYAVNIADCEFGHIEVKDGDGNTVTSGDKVRVGTELRVRAVPDTNCVFESWGEPLQDQTQTVASHTVDADVTFSAGFYRTWMVSIQTSDKGSVSVTTTDGAPVTSGTRLREGTELVIKATANKNCVFEGWKTPSTSKESQLQITLTSDVVAEASFYRTYEVQIAAAKYGQVSVTDSSGKAVASGERVREDTTLTITATPNKNCEFVSWSKPLTGGDANTTWKATSDATFKAKFSRTWLVKIAKSSLGSVSVTTKDGTKVSSGERVREGTVLKVKANPATNCEFSWWTSTLKGKKASTSHKLTSNAALKAQFVRLPLTAKITNVKANSAQIKWTKVKGASRYVVYFERCGSNGLTTVYKKVGSSAQQTDVTGLLRGKTYKFKVVAQKKSGGTYKDLASSLEFHFVTKGSKTLTNPKSIKVQNTKVELPVGGSASIEAMVTQADSSKQLLGHVRQVRCATSNSKVAKVNSKGVIKGKRAGWCTIHVYAENGLRTSIKVHVSQKG